MGLGVLGFWAVYVRPPPPPLTATLTAAPHMGSAYPTIAADVLARFQVGNHTIVLR